MIYCYYHYYYYHHHHRRRFRAYAISSRPPPRESNDGQLQVRRERTIPVRLSKVNVN